MSRFIIPMAALAMLGLVYLIIGDVGFQTRHAPPTAAQDASAQRQAPPARVYVDAAAPESDAGLSTVTNVAQARRFGALGLRKQWLEAVLEPGGWRASGAHTFTNEAGTTLRWRVVGDHVLGADVWFEAGASSAGLTALSSIFVGDHAAMPLHLEAVSREAATPQTGTFETEDGRTLFYRATFNLEGDPPFGPKTMTLSTQPLLKGAGRDPVPDIAP